MSKNQPFSTFSPKKTQSRADKNHSLPAVAGFRFRCRDKIEPNLQSQNVRRTHSQMVESRFQRDQKLTPNRCRVNAFLEISAIFCQATIPLDPAVYLFR
jgi:hypothetical protein